MSIEMTDTELEAIAYAVGDTRLAGLFARIVDMQSEVDDLQTENNLLTCEVDDLKEQVKRLEREALC